MRYSEFAHKIDIDALEEALGFEPIERRDGEDRGYCPLPWGLHKNGDTTGKFSINREKTCFNCFVCEGGSLLSLTMAMRDLDVDAATSWLAQFTQHTDSGGTDDLDEIDQRYSATDKRKVKPYFNTRALDKWLVWYELCGGDNDLYSWLNKRDIDIGTAKRFKVGYDLTHVARGRGDPWTGASVILPHFWEGRLMGWQSCWQGDRPKWVAKYTNTSDFPRGWTLWGYDEAIKEGKPILVESVPTALRLWSMGFPAIATFGSSVSEAQLVLLRGFLDGVMLSPDNDAPGEKWLATLSRYLERYTTVKILPAVGEHGNDLGDIPKADVLRAIWSASY